MHHNRCRIASARLGSAASLALTLFMIAPQQALAMCSASAPGNFSSITQTGSAATGSVDQSGFGNSAACITQASQSAIAQVMQLGDVGGANAIDVVQANGANQSVFAQQNGSGNYASVDESQALGATVLDGNSLLPTSPQGLDPGVHYAAVVVQSGTGNTASIDQQPGSDGSYAEILQYGSGNSGAITQSNTINALAGSNFASILQQGSYNSAGIFQNGSSLVGTIVQTGNSQSAALTQTGQNLEYHIQQDGGSTQAWGLTGGVPDVMVNSTLPGITVTQSSGLVTNVTLH